MSTTARSRGDSGPSAAGLLILGIAALAIVATSPAPPTIEGYAIGEVMLDGTHPAERDLRFHLDPKGGGPGTGSLVLKPQSANGLGDAWPIGISLALRNADGTPVAADDQGSYGAGGYAIPVDRCETGCDFDWRVVVTPTEPVLPGSTIRFEADARLEYPSGPYFGPGDNALLSLTLQDPASGPPAASWSVLAGLLSFVLGAVLASRIDRRLGDARRAWPARMLLFLVLAWLALRLFHLSGFLLNPQILAQLGSPLQLLPALDPWPLAILGTLAWGIWLGIRRLPRDGGWTLGLAGVATAGLGGLWLVWDETSWAVFHPVVFGVVLSVPAALAGIVVGQAWSADPSRNRDRTWAAVAAVAHGILIAGFGFLAAQALSDPFQTSDLNLLMLIPAALLAVAFARWLRGGRRWLILFDLLIAAAGVLGLLVGRGLLTFSRDPDRIELADVGVAIASIAAFVALATAFHRMRRPSPDGDAPTEVSPPPQPTAGPVLGLDPPTT